jgi:hypothetical protein
MASRFVGDVDPLPVRKVKIFQCFSGTGRLILTERDLEGKHEHTAGKVLSSAQLMRGTMAVKAQLISIKSAPNNIRVAQLMCQRVLQAT